MKSSPNPRFIDPNTGSKSHTNKKYKREQRPESSESHANESDLENGDKGISVNELVVALSENGESELPSSIRMVRNMSLRTISLSLIAIASFAICVYLSVDAARINASHKDAANDDEVARSPSPAPGPSPSPVDPTNPLLRISFTTPVNSSVQLSFDRAVSFWNNVVSNDLETIEKALLRGGCSGFIPPDSVDGLLIVITITEIDGESGVLGSAGPCGYELVENRWRPRVGVMRFDSADVEVLLETGQMDLVIIHELAHVLGFGTLWDQGELLETDESLSANHRYVGKHGNQGYRDLDGYEDVSEDIPYVPVENKGGTGTVKGHWRDGVFKTELMTGFLSKGVNNPLSLMTIRALRDLGYTVDESKSEAYRIPSPAGNIFSRDADDSGTEFLSFGDDMILPDESDFSRAFD